MPERTAAYWNKRAHRYDEESIYDKGDRQQQYQILLDVLGFIAKPDTEFCDLGCGTGFFTRAFLEFSQKTRGVAIDVSPEMLAIAAEKLSEYAERITYVDSNLGDIRWGDLNRNFDVIFSSLAIHHLEDLQKWRLFERIYTATRPAGHFVLFDLIRSDNTRENELLEHLACCDIQRRLANYLAVDLSSPELELGELIQNDRRMRGIEGDKEATLRDTVDALLTAGFCSVAPFFQDARIVGLCCTRA